MSFIEKEDLWNNDVDLGIKYDIGVKSLQSSRI